MVNIGEIGSSVLGIAGMGIGLGLLAHTANNISRMSDRMYDPPARRRQSYRQPARRPVSYRPPRTRTRASIRSRTSKPTFYNPWY